MGENNISESKILLDMRTLLDDRLEKMNANLENKNDKNYQKLEDKIDSNYVTLDKRMAEFNDTIAKTIDSVKDKLQDHEYRLRNVESCTKNSNDEILKILTKTVVDSDEKKREENHWSKKLLNPYVVIAGVVLTLVFVSGRFEVLYPILKVLLPFLKIT